MDQNFLWWSDRVCTVESLDDVADAVVACVFDHYYDRPDSCLPYGLSSTEQKILGPIVTEFMTNIYPDWSSSTVPFSIADENYDRLKKIVVEKLSEIE